MTTGKPALVGACLLAWTLAAQAEVVYQCVLPDGNTVLQDRPCPRRFSPEELASIRKAVQPASKPASPVVLETPREAAKPRKKNTTPIADNPDCPCSADAVCTGKRGGRYCFSESGKKRYLPRQPK